MKASDSVKNYPSERRMYANYVARNLKKVCKEFGPRPSGSDSEYESQKWMVEDLKTTCDNVDLEEFEVRSKAYYGWIGFDIILTLISALFCVGSNYLQSISFAFNALGIVCCFIGILVTFFEFILLKKPLDFIFKKSLSHNIVAVRKPTGEIKKRIIFTGHADSSPEWKKSFWSGKKFLLISTFCPLVILFLLNAFKLSISLINNENVASFDLSLVVTIISAVMILFVFLSKIPLNTSKFVEGANNNLTGCLISMSVPRFLQDHDIKFENTEIVVLITGSKESGLRGAKAFCDDHADDFKSDSVETVFVGFDTIKDFESISVINKDLNGFVNNNEEVCTLLSNAAEICGYSLTKAKAATGATDAAVFSKAGLKSATISAVNLQNAKYYNSKTDTNDNIDLKAIEAGVDIALETAFLFDEKGLN